MRFRDRTDAGEQLAVALAQYVGQPDTIILAIPRGALQIGAVLAEKLHLPLDVVLTKKIGAPENPEFAIGAVTPDGQVLLNEDAAGAVSATSPYIQAEAKRLAAQIAERSQKYRGETAPPTVQGKTVILVDDGVATGMTIRAAIAFLARQHPRALVVAVPTGAADTLAALEQDPAVTKLIALDRPKWFGAVGEFYDSFPQVEDDEAIAILQKFRTPQTP